MKPALLAAALALAVLTPALAAEPVKVEVLAWIAGDWIQTGPEGDIRETWLAPRGGAMAGINQAYLPGKPVSMEYMKITQGPEGPVFTAQPAGQPATDFKLVGDGRGEAVFENPAHDFPQRVIYRRCDADLCARIEGTIGGRTESMDWRFKRMP